MCHPNFRKFTFFTVVIILSFVLSACSAMPASETQVPVNPTATSQQSAVSPEPTKTQLPTPTVQPTPTQNEPVLLASGTYLEWTKESDSYRQKDGTYLIPVQDLIDLDSGAYAILFEGEFYNSVGTHSICYVTGIATNGCNIASGKIHINQGSFWGYSLDSDGVLPDDLLMVFAHDKWQNWHDQGIKGHLIEVFASTGTVSFAAGVEPKLSPSQKLIVDNNAAERCPSDSPVLLENPYSDAYSKDDQVVVGAPGSFACRTLFVGKLTENGALVAYYWRGAKDGFSYVAKATDFYLIPESWGEAEMKAFAVKLNAEFLGQYTNTTK